MAKKVDSPKRPIPQPNKAKQASATQAPAPKAPAPKAQAPKAAPPKAVAPKVAVPVAAKGAPAWFTCFLVLLALLPLPFGSNRPWASDIFAFLTGGLLLWMLAAQKPSSLWAGTKLPARRLWAAAGCFTAVVVWSFIQVSPFTPESWHHPIWQEAAKTIGNVSGVIAVDPGAFPESLLRLLSYAGCFILTLVGAREEGGAKLMIKVLAYTGMGYALYGILVHSSGTETILWFDKWAYHGFVTSTFVNKNSYAAYAGLGLLCALALNWRALSHITIKDKILAHQSKAAAFFASLDFRHYALAALPLTLLAALVLSGSRAGIASTLVGAFVFLLAMALHKRMSANKWMKVLGVFLALFLLLVAMGGEGLTSRLDSAKLDDATNERMAAYTLATQAISDNPWLGFGLGSFDGAFRLYRDATLPVWFHHAHNDYLEMAMDLGLPAALLLGLSIGLLLSCCVQGLWVRKRGALFPSLALGATALIMSHGFVDFSMHIPAIAATYASLLGLGVAQSWSTREKT